MVMCTLLLQKPHEKSKSRDHVGCLERRMKSWLVGNIEELIAEGRTIQGRLRSRKARSSESTTRAFTNLMVQGRVAAAMRVINDTSSSGVLDLDSRTLEGKTVREVLKDKHPKGKQASSAALLDPSEGPSPPHPVLFDRITGAAIKSAVLRTFGAAGPSGIDAKGWRRMCTSFHSASKALCDALALVARRLATSYVDPEGLEPFTACRLIPLDKCPGVRPIGITEVARRIVGKAIMMVVKDDVVDAVGSQQLSAGQPAGCETAVHVMRKLFADADVEGVLLVDAKNAFNALNRKAAVWNVRVLCPALGPVVTNTYRSDTDLFVGGESLMSTEGTTQGDPLAMAIYAVAISPLIRETNLQELNQIWFADDAAGGSKIAVLRKWWELLSDAGPKYGYDVNAEKTWLIVKEKYLNEAEQLFRQTGVSITVEGRRHLGGAIGQDEFLKQYVDEQVQVWTNQVERLANIAKSDPHVAYTAYRHSLASQWMYFLRTVPGVAEQFLPLEEKIRQSFIPALTGQEIPGEQERKLLALPSRLGGLGISNPAEIAGDHYDASQRATAPLVALIVDQKSNVRSACEKVKDIRKGIHLERRHQQMELAQTLKENLSVQLQRHMEVASEKGASTWLEALPIKDHGFHLSKTEFRDTLCLRYGWQPARLPAYCVCGHDFDTSHALSCPTGGFPSIRHNEIRDVLAKTMSEVCSDVVTEPLLFVGQDQDSSDNGRLDIRARGFWEGRLEVALFDVRVFNPFAASAVSVPLPQLYRRNENEKRRKYEQALLAENCSFTPLIFSTAGGVSQLTKRFLQMLSTRLSEKKLGSYAQALCWLRTRLAFTIARAGSLCLRGCRVKFRNKTDVDPVSALSAARLM